MKLFTKVALVSAMAISANAMAMQALDDSTLGNTTGQDGITIAIDSTGVTIDKVFVHDTDGLRSTDVFTKGDGTTVNLGGTGDGSGTATATTRTGSGALVVNGLSITKDPTSTDKLLTLVLDTDGGAAADGSGAFLNIGVNIAPVKISLTNLSVTKSGGVGAAGILRAGTAETTILNGLSLNVGATKANIQLGNTPQGSMILLNGSMTGGLSLGDNHRGVATYIAQGTTDGLSLHDAGSTGGGDLVVGSIGIADAGSTNLTTDLGVRITPTGLAVDLGANNYDIALNNVRIGSAASAPIGDIEIQGLHTSGTSLFISGH